MKQRLLNLLYFLYRLVHAFTSAGMLPSQYIRFSKFAGLGEISHWFIRKGIMKLGSIL